MRWFLGLILLTVAFLPQGARSQAIVLPCVPAGVSCIPVSAANPLPTTVGGSGLVIGTTPITGGATTQVLFNLGGVVSSDSGLTYAGSGGTLTLVGGIQAASYQTGGGFFGTSSGLTQSFWYQTAGTVPVDGSGSCATATSSYAGGASAGTFTVAGICAGTTTIATTFAYPAPTGYVCDIVDRTTAAAALRQTATTTTKVTYTIGVANVANDIFQYKCMAY